MRCPMRKSNGLKMERSTKVSVCFARFGAISRESNSRDTQSILSANKYRDTLKVQRSHKISQ